MKLGFWGTLGNGFSLFNHGGDVIQWLLRDDFLDTVPAGLVSGTYATDNSNKRMATDTNSKLSIGSGQISFATGGVGVGNPGLWYPAWPRAAGRTLFSGMNQTNVAAGSIGWDYKTNGAPLEALRSVGTALSIFTNGSAIVVGAVTVGALYYVVVVLRAAGSFHFIKGGTEYPNWTLLYVGNVGTFTPLYPCMPTVGATTVFISPKIRVPENSISITPVASDAFLRSNGTLGNTGGGGSEESGGSGLVWSVQKGTGAIVTNKATFSALTDSLGIATVPCETQNVVAEVVATRVSGTSGLCSRYTDANNYIKAIHDGTNCQVIEVVGGTPNTLLTAAIAYSATARLIVALDGALVRAWYNNTVVGTVATTAITSGNNHGLFTDDVGATFDNLVIWKRGGGAYDSALNRFLA